MAHNLKILHTIGRLSPGGLEGGVIKLVNCLSRAHFSPFLVAIDGFDDIWKSLLADDVNFMACHKKEGRDWSIVRKLALFFKDNKIDIVHSHNWVTFLYSYLATHFAGVSVFIHGEHGRDSEQPDDSRLKAWAKQFLGARSDHLTTVSRDIANLMMEQWHINPAKITVIPNGIDFSRFHFSPDRGDAKTRLGFSRGAWIIGTTIGTLRPVKDLPTLVSAFARVKCSYSNSALIIIGKINNNPGGSSIGNGFGKIHDLINSNNLSDSVIFTGYQQEIHNYMRAMDVYVNSSLYEGMSNTILEAMACGAAVVATRVGGTPFIIKDFFNGLLVPSKSPDLMAESICLLLENTGLMKKLVHNARYYVEKQHSLENFVAAHEKLYHREFLKKSNRNHVKI